MVASNIALIMQTLQSATYKLKRIRFHLHLFIRPLSHTHHEEEKSRKENSFHCGDDEECIRQGTRRPDGHCWKFLEGNRIEIGNIQFLCQSEAVWQQSQWGRDQAAENKITHPLLNHLHLETEIIQRKLQQHWPVTSEMQIQMQISKTVSVQKLT